MSFGFIRDSTVAGIHLLRELISPQSPLERHSRNGSLPELESWGAVGAAV